MAIISTMIGKIDSEAPRLFIATFDMENTPPGEGSMGLCAGKGFLGCEVSGFDHRRSGQKNTMPVHGRIKESFWNLKIIVHARLVSRMFKWIWD